MRRPFLLLLLLGVVAGLGEAYGQEHFEPLTVDDGLSQNVVTALLQDDRGFLWIGTADGLNRYDGYGFTVFQYDPTDTGSLQDNRIGALLQGRDGTLWVGHAAGLSRFDPTTATFTAFPLAGDGAEASPAVSALWEDERGRLWIGHAHPEDRRVGGLTRLDPATGAVEHVLRQDGPLPVWALAPTPDGALWIATDRGLYRHDLAAGTFAPMRHDPQNDGTLAAPSVRTLRVDAAGLLWAGTWGGGLDCIDPRTRAIEHHRAGPGGTELASGFVTALAETADGSLWVGTTDPGGSPRAALHRYDGKTFIRYRHDPAGAGTIGPGGVTALLEDHARVLWVGTARGGLSKADRVSRPIPHIRPDPDDPFALSAPSVHSFIEEDKLTLWVGTARGLDRYNRFLGEFAHLRHDPANPNSLSHDHVTALAYGPDSTLWVGTRRGLNALDRRTRRIRRYLHDAADPAAVPRDDVRALHVGPDGTVWVGTARGLDRFDAATGTFAPVASGAMRDGPVSVLYARPEEPGVLWVGTEEEGLVRFETATGTARAFPVDPADSTALSHRAVTAVVARPEEPGALWIGTQAGGLHRLDLDSGRVRRYNRRSSRMPSNTVYAVQPDNSGLLWVATSQGLVRFDPATGEAQVYDVDRGIQSRQFNPGASYRTPRGELAFGGIDGFNLFRPSDLVDSPYTPRVVITDVQVRGESLGPGEGALPGHGRPVVLPYDANDLTFAFVGLHFARPEGNRYAVRLQGHDDWREIGTERTVSYANLPPGDYRFHVRAANSDGVWGEDTAAVLVLIIDPPFWATWWFRLVAGLALVGVAVAAYRWRIRRIAHRNRELEGLVAERTDALRAQTGQLEAQNEELAQALGQLRTTQTQLVQAEKLASLGRLTAGVAHEIKNPLNFVNNFALLSEELAAELRTELAAAADRPVGEVLDDIEPLLDDLAMNAGKIAEHGRRADGIVRAMLLHARGTGGAPEPTPLHVLLDETLDLAVHGVGASGDGVPVRIERDYDPNVGDVSIIRQAIGRVVLNLLDNALYALREHASAAPADYVPTLWLRTRAGQGRVRIEVADNGPGIPEDVRARLFEPFFTTKPTGAGTGLGLSLAHDIVQGHGGALTVGEASEGGAVFTITLPWGDLIAEGAD